MDDNKRLLGKLLGEIYRLQRTNGMITAGEAHTFALLNGFEDAINEELEAIGQITVEQVRHVRRVLGRYFDDRELLNSLHGFYNIEDELEAGGVDRVTAIDIFKYLKTRGDFEEIIQRMDSGHSPEECRRFELNEDEK